jgi:hypothetical protein
LSPQRIEFSPPAVIPIAYELSSLPPSADGGGIVKTILVAFANVFILLSSIVESMLTCNSTSLMSTFANAAVDVTLVPPLGRNDPGGSNAFQC